MLSWLISKKYTITNQAGMTVAELLTTVAILSIIISAVFAFLIQGTETFKFSDTQVETQRRARIALKRITKDYRGCYQVVDISDYRLVLRGVTIKKGELERIAGNQFHPAKPSHRDWQISYNDVEPIVYDDQTLTSNYTVIDYANAIIEFSYNPTGNITADYTYDATITYELIDSDDADLIRTIEWTDESGQPQQQQTTLASHIRNRHTDYNRPVFTRQSARRIRVSLIVSERLENYPYPRPYQVETEITRHRGFWGAVGLWFFEEGEGSIAHDSSPYQNDGTITGTPAWREDSHTGDYSFEFYGYWWPRCEVDHDPSLNLRQLTIEAWVKPTYTAYRTWSAYRCILEKPGSYEFYLDGNSRLWGRVQTSDGERSFMFGRPGTSFRDKKWTYMAMSYDGTSISICVDNTVRTSEDSWGRADIILTNNPLRLGVGTYNGDRGYFDGRIDEIRLYSIAKSPSELKLPQE